MVKDIEDGTKTNMDPVIRKISEKMEEEGNPMINLAGLFIKEPLSLEFLLMITDEEIMTMEQISSDIVYSGHIKSLLEKLNGFGVIDINNNIVRITERGKRIVLKLRREMDRIGREKDMSNLCNLKTDCAYKLENYDL